MILKVMRRWFLRRRMIQIAGDNSVQIQCRGDYTASGNSVLFRGQPIVRGRADDE